MIHDAMQVIYANTYVSVLYTRMGKHPASYNSMHRCSTWSLDVEVAASHSGSLRMLTGSPTGPLGILRTFD